MPKVEIDVDQILTSAVQLDVEVGDKLLVMNGVVVGLVEPHRRVPLPAPIAARAPPVPAAPPPVVGITYAKPDHVVSVLRTAKQPLTAREIGTAMRNGAKYSPVIKSALKQLRDAGKVAPTPDSADARFPRYSLVS